MKHPTMSALQNLARSKEIKNAYDGSDVIRAVKRAHPDIHFRHDIIQSKKVEGLDELNFAPEITKPLIETGKKDAKNALKKLGLLLVDDNDLIEIEEELDLIEIDEEVIEDSAIFLQ